MTTPPALIKESEVKKEGEITMEEPIGLEQIEKAKRLAELESEQEINEIVANLPTEFEVNGKVLKVDCKTIRQFVQIDRCVLEFQKLAFTATESPTDTEEFYDYTLEKNEKAYKLLSQAIFYIVNKNYNEPEISLDWIEENIDFTDGNTADQILDAYIYRRSTKSSVKKILGMRQF